MLLTIYQYQLYNKSILNYAINEWHLQLLNDIGIMSEEKLSIDSLMDVEKDMFNEDLVCINPRVKDSFEMISKLSDLLINKGLVEISFSEAIIAREKEFPTGLLFEGGINVAIPHTDSIHVKSSAVAIGILEKEIEFIQMGSNGERVPVNLIFVLAIKDHKQIVPFLKTFVLAMQSIDLRKKLISVKSSKQVIDLMKIAVDV